VSGRLFRPGFGEAPYEILVRLRRAVSRRDHHLAVQQRGNVAAHTELLASRRLGGSAEGKTDCCATAGRNDRDIPSPDIWLIDSSESGIRAGHTLGQTCQAGAIRQQLQRWLRNQL